MYSQCGYISVSNVQNGNETYFKIKYAIHLPNQWHFCLCLNKDLYMWYGNKYMYYGKCWLFSFSTNVRGITLICNFIVKLDRMVILAVERFPIFWIYTEAIFY